MAATEEPPILFGGNTELNEAVEKLWAECNVIPGLLSLFDQMCDGTLGLSKSQFRILLTETMKESYGEPFSRSVVDLVELLYGEISHGVEHKVYRVSITAIEELGSLLDPAWEIFTDNGQKLATKQDIVTCAALCVAMFDDRPPVISWETAVHMLCAAISRDGEKDEESVVDLSGLKALSKKLVLAFLDALKGIANALLSFDVVFKGQVAALIDELFVKVAGADGKISFSDLAKPILVAQEHASERHREFVLAESTAEVSQAGRLYSALVAIVGSLSDEEVEWEQEAEAYDFALPDASHPSVLAQLLYKLRLCKDACLGRLALSAAEAGDQSVTREVFVRIVTSTFAPLVPEIAKALHDSFAAEEAQDQTVKKTFSFQLKEAFEHHIKQGGMEPLLGSFFDLLDADSSGKLSLQEVLDARAVFHGPGGATLEERFAALVSLFDADCDGEVSNNEVKAMLSKVLNVVRRIVGFKLGILQRVVCEGYLDEQLDDFWEQKFPGDSRLTKKHAFELLANPDDLFDPAPDLKPLENAIKECEDRPVERSASQKNE